MKWRSFLTFLVVGMGATAVFPQARALPSLPMIEPAHDPRLPVETAVVTPLDMDRLKVEKAGHRYYCRYYRRYGTLRRQCWR
ncbi:MAG: hypothetical protein AB7U61_14485 [Methylocystis sp.]